MTVYNDTKCELGEGPLWHPIRNELFWFDILNKTLHSAAKSWEFDEIVSAAGWIDENTLVIASETAFKTFDLITGTSQHLHDLEADNKNTRSNDGRIDPWGGFWIGTMGKKAEKDAGSIYRLHKGELRKLYPNITIPNAICFSPDRAFAYFCDTTSQIVQRQALDEENGWPKGDPEPYLNLTSKDQNPDGAVIDKTGNMWLALWGSSCVSCFNPEGDRLFSLPFTASQISCPAFGGDGLSTLFATSAMEGMDERTRADEPDAGKLFFQETDLMGQEEHRFMP